MTFPYRQPNPTSLRRHIQRLTSSNGLLGNSHDVEVIKGCSINFTSRPNPQPPPYFSRSFIRHPPPLVAHHPLSQPEVTLARRQKKVSLCINTKSSRQVYVIYSRIRWSSAVRFVIVLKVSGMHFISAKCNCVSWSEDIRLAQTRAF